MPPRLSHVRLNVHARPAHLCTQPTMPRPRTVFGGKSRTDSGLLDAWVTQRSTHRANLVELLHLVATTPALGVIVAQPASFQRAQLGTNEALAIVSKIMLQDPEALPEHLRALGRRIKARDGDVTLTGTKHGPPTKLGVVGGLVGVVTHGATSLVAVRVLPACGSAQPGALSLDALAELDAVNDCIMALPDSAQLFAPRLSRFTGTSDGLKVMVSHQHFPKRPIEVTPLYLGSLNDRLRAACDIGDPMPWTGDELAWIADRVLRRLAVLHRARLHTGATPLTHGNLHEGNVLVTEEGNILLAGLGTAASRRAAREMGFMCMPHDGGRAAMLALDRVPPEADLVSAHDAGELFLQDSEVAHCQMRLGKTALHAEWTPLCDTWQVGAMLYRLATGEELYETWTNPNHGDVRSELETCLQSLWLTQLIAGTLPPVPVLLHRVVRRDMGALIVHLTRYPTRLRLTAEQALAHVAVQPTPMYRDLVHACATCLEDPDAAAAFVTYVTTRFPGCGHLTLLAGQATDLVKLWQGDAVPVVPDALKSTLRTKWIATDKSARHEVLRVMAPHVWLPAAYADFVATCCTTDAEPAALTAAAAAAAAP